MLDLPNIYGLMAYDLLVRARVNVAILLILLRFLPVDPSLRLQTNFVF